VGDTKLEHELHNIQLIRNLLNGKRRQSFGYESETQGENDATQSHSAIIYDNGGQFKGYRVSLKT